jgi:hypothetical protein
MEDRWLQVASISCSSVIYFESKIYVKFMALTRNYVDDPQMQGLIPLIKKLRPELPVIYRSHIEIRSDLVHVAGSPQEEVWKYLWNNIKMADLFISMYLCFHSPNTP